MVENSFKYAVYRVSHERGLLTNTHMKYDIQRLPIYNTFDSSKKGKFMVVHLCLKYLSRILLKPVLGGVQIVALSISSNEQTQ